MWKKISSKVILDHKRLKVVEDEVELPGGEKTDYLRFETGGNAATVIAFNKAGKILVQKEYSYPTNEWLYQFPGGFVPEGENIKEGMNRELMEEAGYKAKSLELLGSLYPQNRRSNHQTYVFLAKDLTAEKLVGDKEEDIEVFAFSEDEIDDLIKQNNFKNAMSLSAWAIYKASK